MGGGGGGRCGPPFFDALARSLHCILIKFINKEDNKTMLGLYIWFIPKHTFNYANKFTAWNLERCFYFQKKGKLSASDKITPPPLYRDIPLYVLNYV